MAFCDDPDPRLDPRQLVGRGDRPAVPGHLGVGTDRRPGSVVRRRQPNQTRRTHDDRHDPPDHRPGAGPLDDRAALGAARRHRGPAVPGVFAIFGHGNVLGLAPRCTRCGDELPTWRGQNEQGMALAAVGFARATDRRQVMAVTTSIGPGALNMVTAAGVAHANRLPMLLLPGRHLRRPGTRPGAPAGRALRRPDDVGQRRVPPGRRATSTGSPARSSCSRTLPQVARVLTDPADCGPVVLGDAAGRAGRGVRLPALDVRAAGAPRAAASGRTATTSPRPPRPCAPPQRPLLVVGGGVRYSGAAAEALAFAEAPRRPRRRDRRRPHPGAARPPAVRRRARHHRRHLGQRPRRGGRRRARRRHPAAGLHHLVVDRVRARASGSSPSTPPASTRSSTRPRPSSAMPARRWSSCPTPWATGRPTPAWAAEAREQAGRLGRPRRQRSARASLRTGRSPTRRSSASSTTPAARRTTS